jgi:intein/homing endonuclease
MKIDNNHKEIAAQCKEKVAIVDIETSSPYPIKDFDNYVRTATVKWLGVYSYISNRYYEMNCVGMSKLKIQEFLNAHDTLVSFNGKEFDIPILENNDMVPPKRFQQVDCQVVLGTDKFKHKNRGMLMGYKFPNNKLSTMAKVMKLETMKGDIDYSIFEKNEWNEDETKEIKKYLRGDIEVTKQMFDKLYSFWESFTEMLSEKNVKNWAWLNASVASMAYKADCYEMGNAEVYGDKTEGKEEIGGLVVLPKQQEAIDVYYVDVTSLYPNIFIMFNLFNEVDVSSWSKEEIDKQITNDVLWHGNNVFTVKGYYRIDNHGQREKNMLYKLSERIRLKKEDPDNPLVYAYKITLNATYGIARSTVFKNIYSPNCGADCCLIGQQINEVMQDKFGEHGHKTLSGDSVTKESKILLDDMKYKSILDIWNSNDNDIIYRNGKEMKVWNDKKVLVHNNIKGSIFSGPIEIIRHKVNKNIYRVQTSNQDYVNVTEDHSLIDCYLNEVKPQDAKHIMFMKDINRETIKSEGFILEMYNLLGMMLANGGIYIGSNKKYPGKTYVIDLSFEYMDEYISNILLTLQTEYNLKISGGKWKSSDYKLSNVDLLKRLVSLGIKGSSKTKRVPSFMFDEPIENIREYLKGYMTGDGTIIIRNDTPIIRGTSVNKEMLEDLRILFAICGIPCSIFKESKTNNYKGKDSGTYSHHINILNKTLYKNTIGFSCKTKSDRLEKVRPEQSQPGGNYNLKKRRIASKEIIEYDDYVYDIVVPETQNFFCNNILVHNTDSIFTHHPENKSKEDVEKVCKYTVDYILDNVPFPVNTFNIDIETGDKLDYVMWVPDEKTGEFKKKNYAYIYNKKGKKAVKIMGLPIKKSNATELGMSIFHDHIEQRMLKEVKGKFDKEWISGLIKDEVKRDMDQMVVEYRTSPFDTYSLKGRNCINAQISLIYLEGKGGNIKLLKNKKIGKVGKGFKYCTLEEAHEVGLTYHDLDLTKVFKELYPFSNGKIEFTKTKRFF